MNRKTFLFVITIVIGVGLFVWLFKISGPREILTKLTLISPFQFIVLFSISFLTILISVVRWGFILKTQGHSLSLGDLVVAKLAEMSVSFLTPILYVGGEGVRAYIIKKSAKVPITHGLGSILIDRLAELTAVFLFFFLASIWLLARATKLSWILIILFLIILVLGVIIAFFRLRIFNIQKIFMAIMSIFHFGKNKNETKSQKRSVLLEKLIEIKDSLVSFFKHYPKVFINSILFSLLIIFLTIYQFKLMFLCLGYLMNWDEVVLMRVITGALNFIPIPGSLGTYEGGVILSLQALGISAEGSLAFSLLVRAFQLILVVLGILCIINFAIGLIPKIFLREEKLNFKKAYEKNEKLAANPKDKQTNPSQSEDSDGE